MADFTIDITYFWTATANGSAAPQLDYTVIASDRSCIEFEWDIQPAICEDFPVPDACNQIPLECPPTIRWLINDIMWDVNRKALAEGKPHIAIDYDQWRDVKRKIEEVAPQIASQVGGFYVTSRIRVEPGRRLYCLPSESGPINRATFGCDAVNVAQAEFFEQTYCPVCMPSYPMYFMDKVEIGNYGEANCPTGLPTGFAVHGSSLILNKMPEEIGEIRVWHRAQTLITEECGCSDLIFETCQCKGVHPQSAGFYGGVSKKHLALVKKAVIGEWFMITAEEHSVPFKTEANALARFYRENDPRPELTNTRPRRRYKGF